MKFMSSVVAGLVASANASAINSGYGVPAEPVVVAVPAPAPAPVQVVNLPQPAPALEPAFVKTVQLAPRVIHAPVPLAPSPVRLLSQPIPQFAPAPLPAPIAPMAQPLLHAAPLPAPIVPAPAVANSQFHAQDEFGGFSFGYQNGNSAKQEVRTPDGVTRGSYSYVDANGVAQEVNYIADPVNGFQVVASNLPVGPAAAAATPLVAVQETPEVAAARADFLLAYDEALVRNAVAEEEAKEVLTADDSDVAVARKKRAMPLDMPLGEVERKKREMPLDMPLGEIERKKREMPLDMPLAEIERKKREMPLDMPLGEIERKKREMPLDMPLGEVERKKREAINAGYGVPAAPIVVPAPLPAPVTTVVKQRVLHPAPLAPLAPLVRQQAFLPAPAFVQQQPRLLPQPLTPAVTPLLPAPAPVVTPLAAAAPAPVVPLSSSSQFQAQDEFGGVSFGYQNLNSARQESRTPDGVTTGSYSYVDANGITQTVNYVADALGYRVVGTNLPVAPVA